MTHTRRKIYLNIWLPLIFASLLVAVMTYWIVRPYNYLTFGDYYVNAESYRPGEFVQVTISEFCTNGISNSNERWLDGQYGGVGLPPLRFYGQGEPSCMKDLKVLVQIPMETVPGQYRLEFITRYQPNPIRTVSLTTYTPYFQVTK